MVAHLLLYALSFFLIWYGSGHIIGATSTFSKKLRVSPFLFSFLFLGLLTSIPELSVGLQSIANNHSEVFVGNLLGGVIVLFLLIIPLLAVMGNGINVKNELGDMSLLFTSIVILAPAFFVLDKVVTNFEGAVMVVLYIALMLFIQRNQGILDIKNKQLMETKNFSYKDIVSLLFGLGLVFVASRILLDKTIYFADLFGVSAFYISLIAVALGTDMPEFVLAMRSALHKKKDVAMGDYVGAGAASTLLFGIFTLLNDGEVVTVGNFWVRFIFIALALFLFWVFSRSKKTISRGEGFLLLGVYVVFLSIELLGRQ